MSSQSKSTVFGSSSTHKVSQKKHNKGQNFLTKDEFLSLSETKAFIAENPGSTSVVDGEITVCHELAIRYLNLCGNKRALKAFKKASGGK